MVCKGRWTSQAYHPGEDLEVGPEGSKAAPRRWHSQARHGEGWQASPWPHEAALGPLLRFLLSSSLATTLWPAIQRLATLIPKTGKCLDNSPEHARPRKERGPTDSLAGRAVWARFTGNSPSRRLTFWGCPREPMFGPYEAEDQTPAGDQFSKRYAVP